MTSYQASTLPDNDLLSIDTRQQEESRIVATWLKRLRNCIGQDQQAAFRRGLDLAGISPGDLEGGGIIRQSQMDIVVHEVRRDVPDVILRLFAQAEVLDLGLIGYAALNCGTLGKALDVLYQYQSIARDQYVDQLEIRGDLAIVSPVAQPGHQDDYLGIAEDSLTGNWRSLQVLLGPAADPRKISVHFDYPAPAYEQSYHDSFGQNCWFDQERTELRFPAAWLDIPINRSNSATTQVFTAMCERILGPGKSKTDTRQQVKRLLLSRPGRSMLRLEQAAEQLRLSPGQLRKRLYRGGATYKAIVLETRMELAHHYLRDTHLSVQEIAYLLDYASPAPFSRAFKQYYGIAPDYYRVGEKH